MLRNLERPQTEVGRVRRPRSAVITPAPGLPEVDVSVGDIVEIEYDGDRCRVRVLAIRARGLLVRDFDKRCFRAFSYELIGRERVHETDAAAS
jgi:ribosomal 50S subunit-recycling heat shock protein